MVTVFIAIVGGRVIPIFTSNRLGLTIAPLPSWLEYLAIGSVLPIMAAKQTLLAWRTSAILWIVVFGVFLYRYLPILTRPRADDPSGQGETKLK